MLRCRPTEIALTAADVDETRRRLARRQAAGIATAIPIRHPGAQGGIPRIRRGPGRSRDDAVAHLGSIPNLRPQSANQSPESFDSDDGLPRKADYRDGSESTSVGNDENASSAEEQLTPLPPPRSIPALVPTPHQGISSGRRVESVDGSVDEEIQSSPPKHQFGFSGFGSARTSTTEDANGSIAGQSPRFPVDGVCETPESASDGNNAQALVSRIMSLRQRSGMAPSPLHQSQAASPPQQTHDGQIPGSQPEEYHPTIYLEGYFQSPERYSFREIEVGPQRSFPNQPGHDTRYNRIATSPEYSQLQDFVTSARRGRDTSPSSDLDDHRLPRTRQTTQPRHDVQSSLETSQIRRGARSSLESSVRDPRDALNLSGRRFGNHASDASGFPPFYEAPAHSQTSGLNGSAAPFYPTRRDHRSSSSSQPYPWYGIPSSRYSSSNYSQPGPPLGQAQYDGASPSRPISQAPSGRLPPLNTGMRSPAVHIPSHSSPNLMTTYAAGRMALSPPPARPYGRPGSSQSITRPSTGLITPHDFTSPANSALNAARRNLSSPLDLIQQRAESQMYRVPSGTSFYSAASQPDQHPIAPVFQYQVPSFTTPLPYRTATRSGTEESQHIPSSTGSRYASETRDWDRHPDFPTQPRASRPLTPLPTPRGQRSATGARTNARSSENVGPMSPQTFSSPPQTFSSPPQTFLPPPAISQLPSVPRIHNPNHNHSRHREHGSRRSSAAPTRRTTAPVDLPVTSVFPPHVVVHQQLPTSRPRTADIEYGSSSVPHIHSSRSQPRHRSTHHSAHPSRPSPARARRESENRAQRHHAPPHTYREREPALPQHVGERSMIQRARSSRLPAWQQEQENSGGAEEEAMREEMMARGPRGGGADAEDVMDETPPRLGRFERRGMGL